MKSFFLSISLLWAANLSAQTPDQARPHHNDANDQINVIAEQQRQILSELAEIKQLLASMGRPFSQPPTPPTVLSLHDERFRGEQSATVAIVEYADFECPYCGEYEHDVYPQIAENYIQTGKVKYYFRDLPLPMHPHAMIAARAARCAGEQGKFWEMHDSLFAKQNMLHDIDMPERAKNLGLDTSKFSECLASGRYTDEIKQSVAEAEKFGVDGTPAFFIGKIEPDGQLTRLKPILGVHPYGVFKAAIEESLAATAEP